MLFRSGLRPRELGNPLESVAEPRVLRRERLLTASEITALLKALEADTASPVMASLINLIVLTGFRVNEAIGLQWNHVEREAQEFRLPDTKTGHSVRPLGEATLTLIDKQERMPGCPYVFHVGADPVRYFNLNRYFHKVTAAAGIEGQVTIHTIRHYVCTQTANSTSNMRVAMAMSGHKSIAAYSTYLHAHRDQAKALADQIGDATLALGTAPSNVSTMPKRGSK